MLRFPERAEPSNPPAGSYRVYVDSADQELKIKDSTGVVTKIANIPATPAIIDGLITLSVTAINSDTTLNTTTHRYIKVDTSGGDVTLTLPLSANGVWPYDIWKTSSDNNTVTVVRSGSDTISGDTSAFWHTEYAHSEFFPDGGTEWLIK